MRRAPRALRLLAALLALGTGVGCPPRGPCTEPPPPPLFEGAMFAVGQPLELTIDGVFSSCATAQEDRAQSVTVEVKDPLNRVVPATAELAARGGSAIVRFTPEQTGRYHLVVSFAPVGSVRQSVLHVMEDQRAKAPLAELSTVVECLSVDRTASGTWLCGSQALRGPDAEPQPLGDYFAPTVVAGDVVWVTDSVQVRRHVDEGNGPLRLSASAPFPATGAPANAPPHSRLATPDELLLLDEGHLHRYAYSEAEGLRAMGSVAVADTEYATFEDQVSSLLVRAGSRVLVARLTALPPPEEGLVAEACPFQVNAAGAPEAVPDEPCHRVPGVLAGLEEGVLWTHVTRDAGHSELLRYSAASGRLVLEGVLPVDAPFQSQTLRIRQGPGLPLVFSTHRAENRYAAPQWRADTGTVVPVIQPAPSDRQPPRVGGRYLWLEHWNTLYGVTVYSHPSTP
ncbi:hypothetical protein [Corallococcus macrosporus]|uniref:Lipoprotein n=1 Tax=Myxococcus fulvus (strain ATCC BAA-855 / HW-1) TaxID=483219 RepID=F8C7M8_MYXFH|nr:hypothetical protein [Corallococcus macrosporus]AEI64428.1 hypothetical protein LILAB_12605 [Corallococcus macrosporus]